MNVKKTKNVWLSATPLNELRLIIIVMIMLTVNTLQNKQTKYTTVKLTKYLHIKKMYASTLVLNINI